MKFLHRRIDSIMKEDCMTKHGNACIQRSVRAVICMTSSMRPEQDFDLKIFRIIINRLMSLCDGDHRNVCEIENAWYLLDIARHFVSEENNLRNFLQNLCVVEKETSTPQSSSSQPINVLDNLVRLAESHNRRGNLMICMFIWQIIGVLSSGSSSPASSSLSSSSLLSSECVSE